MTKIFFRFFCIFLFSLSNLAFAQEGSLIAQEQTAPDEENNFFDPADAPVSYKGAFIKMMLTLLALIALVVISVWMLRRISHGRIKQMNYGKEIKILERRPLSAKSILYLVEIGGKKVVIAESQLEVRSITTADHLPIDED